MLCLRELIGIWGDTRYFALESAVNELAQTLHMDPTVLRAKNMVREGQMMPAYYGGDDEKLCSRQMS